MIATLEPANDKAAACWDSNGNGVQDAAEDRNGDGIFDVQDCVVSDMADNVTLRCTDSVVDMMASVADELFLELSEARANQVRYTFISRSGTADIMATIRGALEQYQWEFARALSGFNRNSNRTQHLYECREDASSLTVTIEPIGRSFRYTLVLERTSN